MKRFHFRDCVRLRTLIPILCALFLITSYLPGQSATSLSLPSSVTATVNYGSTMDTNTSTQVTISGLTGSYSIMNGVYDGWCIDPVGATELTASYSVYNSYPPASLPANVVLAGNPAVWNEVNWLVNNYATAVPSATVNDVQYAIWTLLDPPYVSNGGTTTANSSTLVADAQANPSFVPTAGQVVAVVLDNSGIQQSTGFGFQPAPQSVIILVSVPKQPNVTITKSVNISNPKPYEAVTYTYVVTNNGGVTLTNIQVIDDNATPDYTGDDIVVGTAASLAPGQSVTFTSTRIPPVTLVTTDNSGNQMNAGTVIVLPAQQLIAPPGTTLPSFGPTDIAVIYRQSQSVNDNTYGNSTSLNWTSTGQSHHFSDLVAGDSAEFTFEDGAGNTVLDFSVDYLSQTSKNPFTGQAYPSGYGSAGLGGDGHSATVGSSSSVLFATTTMTTNLNQGMPYYWSYYQNSPSWSDSNSGNWDNTDGYTVVVSGKCFGSHGFGCVKIPNLCNTPSIKCGNKPPVTERCSGSATNTATVSANAVVNGVSETLTASDTATVTVVATGSDCGVGCTTSAKSVGQVSGNTAPSGSYIWLDSVVQVSGLSTKQSTTISITDASVILQTTNGPITVPVPNGQIVFSTSATTTSTLFNSSTNTWVTTVPVTTKGYVFISGVQFQLPVAIPSGTYISWDATFSSSTQGVSLNWKWYATPYSSLSSNCSQLNVKCLDGYSDYHYKNQDCAGTPENCRNDYLGKCGWNAYGVQCVTLCPPPPTQPTCPPKKPVKCPAPPPPTNCSNQSNSGKGNQHGWGWQW